MESDFRCRKVLFNANDWYEIIFNKQRFELLPYGTDEFADFVNYFIDVLYTSETRDRTIEGTFTGFSERKQRVLEKLVTWHNKEYQLPKIQSRILQYTGHHS